MKRKTFFSLFGTLVLATAIGIGVYLVQQRQEIRRKAAPATTLALTPSQTSPVVNQNFEVTININTGENLVVGTELYLNFDATKLEALTISLGSFLISPQALEPAIDNTAGTINYTLYLAPGNPAQTGQGTLAVISFKPKATGNAAINFAANTLVGAIGEEGQNALTSSIGTTVNIRNLIGDINTDNHVDILDYTLLFEHFSQQPPTDIRTDINQDGKVNILDYVLLFEHFGEAV